MHATHRFRSTSYFYLCLGSIRLYDTATIGTKYIARERPNVNYKIITCFSIWAVFLYAIRCGWCHYRTYPKWDRSKFILPVFIIYFSRISHTSFILHVSAYVEMASGSYPNDAIAKRRWSSYSHIRTTYWVSQYSHEVRSIIYQCKCSA